MTKGIIKDVSVQLVNYQQHLILDSRTQTTWLYKALQVNTDLRSSRPVSPAVVEVYGGPLECVRVAQ